MKFRFELFIFLALVSFVILPFVSAESPAPGLDQVPFANQTEQIGEVVQGKNWDYIGQQWKDIILKNSFVSKLDSFFHNINGLFVVLFARSYTLSFAMFFVLLIWFFTLFSANNYMVFLNEPWQRFLCGLGVTIILAQIGLFNYLAEGAYKIIFYQTNTTWSVLISVLVFLALFVYLILNKIFARKLEAARRLQNIRGINKDVGLLKEFKNSIKKGASEAY